MRPVEHEDEILYFENGFLYKKKKYNQGDYFSPLNFCTLECKTKEDNNLKPIDHVRNNSDDKVKTVQKYPRHIQPRGTQKRQLGGWKLRPHNSIRDGAPRRLKVFYNQCAHGIGAFHKLQTRRNGLHSVFRTPSAVNVHGIRFDRRTKGSNNS